MESYSLFKELCIAMNIYIIQILIYSHQAICLEKNSTTKEAIERFHCTLDSMIIDPRDNFKNSS